MIWVKTGTESYESEDGRFRVRGGYDDGNYWRAIEAATGRLVVASSDKEFVKLRCEIDARRDAKLWAAK